MVGFQNSRQRLVLLTILCVVLAGLWHLISVPQPDLGSVWRPVDLAAIDQLAREEAEQLPLRLEYRILVERQLPFLMAGSSACYNRTPVRAVFRLVYDNFYVLIDPGPDPRDYRLDPGGRVYHTEQAAAIRSLLLRARHILFSWPGADAMGLAARSPGVYHYRDHLRFTRPQLRSPRLRSSGFPPAVLEVARQVEYQDYKLLEPGLVLVRPDVLQPARQWFYIRLRGGRSLLLLDPALPHVDCLQAAGNPNRLHLYLEGQQAYPLGLLTQLQALQADPRNLQLVMRNQKEFLMRLEGQGLLVPMQP